MKKDPSFKQHIEGTAQKHLPMLLKLIEQGKAEGKITHGVSAKAIMMYLNSLSAMMSNPEVRENLDVELRKEMTHLFLHSIFGNEAEE